MSSTFYAQSYLDLVGSLQEVDGDDARCRVVEDLLARSSVLQQNASFVGVAFALALGRAPTGREFVDLLLAALNRPMTVEVTLLDAHAAVVAACADGSVCSAADFLLMKELSGCDRNDPRLAELAPLVLGGVAWFPFSVFTFFVKTLDDVERFFELDPFVVADFGTWAASICPSVSETSYGALTQAEVDDMLSSFVGETQFIMNAVSAIFSPCIEYPIDMAGVESFEVEFLARAVANMVHDGHDFEAAMQAAMINAAEQEAMGELRYPELVNRADPTVDQEVRRPAAERLLESYLSVYTVLRHVVESLEELVFYCRTQVDEYVTTVVAPATMLMDVASRMGTAIHSILTQLIGALLNIADSFHWSSSDVRAAVGTILFGLADLVDIKHRKNPKSVWALLTTRRGARLTRSELFLTQLATFSHVPSSSYESWAEDMIRRMGRSGVDVDNLRVAPPSRAVYYPRNTFGPRDNNDLELAVDVHFHETIRETRRVQQALAKGAPRGIDSAWFATASTVQASIDRYVVPRPTVSPEVKMLIRDAADAVFEHDPTSYDRPQPMSVAAAMLAVEWKYSAGLPFIPVIRTRQQLKQSRLYQAIASAAESFIEEGTFPDIAFHGFPKTVVTKRSGPIEDPSSVRTVTAGDRITAILANTLLGEVNKRVSPLESWVANQLPRREGGMQEMYNALVQRPCIVTTDGWRFDSQVPREIMSIGSTRLYERGIEGWWGAKAATTFVEAYYSAVANGLVVNLMDGSVTRKTGGGGTGSAFTSSDNKNWVRCVMVATWSYTMDLPPREFWDHVTLSNASDDIIFSCDHATEAKLQEWQDNILILCGLRFPMERQPSVDGFLHLRLVPEAMLDHGAYAAVGVHVPDFPVMHDPLRLAMMRSDYRSDKMRHSYIMAADFIATQTFGHMLLVAHDPDTYSDLAHEAMEAVSSYLNAIFDQLEFSVQLNPTGQVSSFSYTVGNAPSPALIRDRHRRFHDGNSPEALAWQAERMRIGRKWIRAHRYPSYLEVFKSWVAPEDWDRRRPAQKKWNKIAANVHVNVPAIDLVQSGMLTIADITSNIPTGLTRWSGQDIVPLTRPLVTNSFMVELFVYEKFRANHGGVAPSYGEFQAKCREAPYGSVTDPNGFWNARTSFDWDNDPRRERDIHVLQGRMWLFTLVYGIIDSLQTTLRMNRIAGFMVAVFFLIVRDLDKWYSLLHLAYWLAHGEASVEISNMSPRDPFIAQKMLALVITATVPLFLFRWMSFIPLISEHVATAAMAFYRGYKVAVAAATRTNMALAAPGDRWDEFIFQYLAGTNRDNRVSRVSAGMGSGKSTSLPRALLDTGTKQQVVVIVPTAALVVNYSNPFFDESDVLRVLSSSDLDLMPRPIVVLTAHRALSLQLDANLMARTVFLFDEVHLATTAQVACWNKFSAYICVGVTGTPRGRLWDEIPGRIYTLPAPPGPTRTLIAFETEQEVRPTQPQTVLAWVREALQAHNRHLAFDVNGMQRFAVFHPTISSVQEIRLMLERSGYLASMTTSNSPGISGSGVVVGTWVIVTGVNFNPPIDGMIDCGLEVYTEPAWTDIDAAAGGLANGFRDRATVQRIGWSSPSTADQVAARCGRVKDGWVIHHPLAGTGPERDPYPDVLILLEHGDSFTAANPNRTLLDVLGFTMELAVNPNPVGPHPLLRWVWFVAGPERLRIHHNLLAVILLFATSLGSVREAIAGVQNPAGLSLEQRQTLERLRSMFAGHLAELMFVAVPQNLEYLMTQVGFATLHAQRPRFRAGRPCVAYPGLISVSGMYPRSRFYN